MTSPDGRYFINNGQNLTSPDYHAELMESLTRINLYNPPVQTCSTGWKFLGFFQGPTSIAYLFYKLSSIYPDLDFKGQSLLDWAQAYLELTKLELKQSVTPDDCGIANEMLASLALNAVISQDVSLALQLCAYGSAVSRAEEAGSDEWLYGRAGFLYFLRLVKSSFVDNQSVQAVIDATIENVVQRILASPQPWRWRDWVFLGAVHGSIGIITQLILSIRNEEGRFDGMIYQLLNLQLDNGGFSTSLDCPILSNDLVQFCHGAPGFVIALQSIISADLDRKLTEVTAAARADTWKRGLLTKTPSLCHGIAGNALALEDDSQFNHFLAHMTTAQLEARDWLADAGHNDRFAGLFGGEAGRAWVWAVADKGLLKTCIGFNDL